jgi:hypothetical protein
VRYGAARLVKPLDPLDVDELEELVRRMLLRPRPPASRPRRID